MIRCALLCFGVIGPVFADDMHAFRVDLLDACLAAGGDAQCIGVGATACLQGAGSGAAGICLGEENTYWTSRIAVAEDALRIRQDEVLDRAAQRGIPAPSLDEIARSFATYRDAACTWRAAQWPGMHTGPEEMDCLMRLTAQHALWLDARVGDL